MKYIMSVEVEAEQYLPQEDKIPKGVISDGIRSPRTDSRSNWMLKTASGVSYIKDGDYVVTQLDGSQYIMDRERSKETINQLNNMEGYAAWWSSCPASARVPLRV